LQKYSYKNLQGSAKHNTSWQIIDVILTNEKIEVNIVYHLPQDTVKCP
jgi:hypothetical protein